MSDREVLGAVRVPTGEKVWTRLDPLSRNAEMQESVRAAIHDPLWLLGRQWQVGEFRAEDAGSPVDAEVVVEHDEVTRLQLGDEPAVEYDQRVHGPLESVVEREAITTDEEPPNARLRAEAGQYFLRLLAEKEETVQAGEFPSELRLDTIDEPLEPADARYIDLMADRTLDGHELFEAIEDETLSPPAGVDSEAFDTATARYADWYRDLYDEPTEAMGEAWVPERFEYSFKIATGGEETETVLTAEEYPGGRLDWYAFSTGGSFNSADDPDEATTVDDTATPTSTTEINRLPTNIDFPGMPAPRWWEFEDSAVNLGELTAPPEGLPRTLMLEFMLVYGNDWFMIPVETPVGTLSRVTELAITDTFGVTTGDVPATDDDWNIFMADLRSTDAEPDKGLFLPPVLGDVAESDPVEQVILMRDEMANLAFGIEERIESPVGGPLDREAFHPPRLSVESMRPAPRANQEVVVLENVGSVELDAEGWSVEIVDRNNERVDRYSLDELRIPPGSSVTLSSGPPPGDPAEDVGEDAGSTGADIYWNRDSPILGDSKAVHLLLKKGPDSEGSDGVVERVRIPPLDGSLLPAYRLATSVPDHWYPLKPTGPDAERQYRYRLARLFDADAFEPRDSNLPQPLGNILGDSAGVDIYEEEVTRAGVELTRSYQFVRWLDGSAHLWSGRRARTGRGEGSSGLRFDILEG